MHIILLPLGNGLFVKVDSDCSFEIWGSNWYAHKLGRRFYAARSMRKPDGHWSPQLMHRVLMPDVEQIDHKDGDGLNATRQNLRAATHQQNMRGFQRKRAGVSSQYRGVYWARRDKKWIAQIKLSGKSLHLGCFKLEADAARAYDDAARKYFDDFASPNFPV